MNTPQAPSWLPSQLVPFFTLSYPTEPPASPKFFKDSAYYTVGPLDACLVLTFIAVMAVLRDVTRLWISEPFARWKLTRDLVQTKNRKRVAAKANGNGNGNGNEHVNGDSNGNGNGHGHANGDSNGNGNGHGHANGDNDGANGHVDVVARLTKKDISKREERKLHRSVLRFAEQGWSFIYYTCMWCIGLYIHRNMPTRVLDPIFVFMDYPYIPLAGPIKFYYLLQTAFYLHQMLILNAEARRKDHWQMMAHHVITFALLVGSYKANLTLVGSLIMLLMDTSDIFLPLAKMLRYLSFTTPCDVTFIVFLVSWLITRHVLYVLVIVAFLRDAPKHMPSVWNPDAGLYMSKNSWKVFSTLLITLQILQLMWFWMIARVAWLVVMGQNAEDTRSDEEGDDDDDEKREKKEK